MPESHPADKIPLTIHLSADVAARLKQAAEAQRRSPAEFAAELLGRHLPRPQTGGPKKGAIPYS
jgi:hypothetical protein